MKKFKFFLLIVIFGLTSSCGVISEGFKSPKQNKSDEFLVEKKSPLKLPPDYDQLPAPLETNNEEIVKESSIEKMIKDNKNETKKSNSNSSLEELVLDKIKSN
tara:strand:+ start:161 stop:469 length:309 start_codon:yes stop_codon:yes gene_type:complete